MRVVPKLLHSGQLLQIWKLQNVNGSHMMGKFLMKIEQVEKNIDSLAANGVNWSACASKEQLQAARDGKLKLRFFDRDVPTNG